MKPIQQAVSDALYQRILDVTPTASAEQLHHLSVAFQNLSYSLRSSETIPCQQGTEGLGESTAETPATAEAVSTRTRKKKSETAAVETAAPAGNPPAETVTEAAVSIPAQTSDPAPVATPAAPEVDPNLGEDEPPAVTAAMAKKRYLASCSELQADDAKLSAYKEKVKILVAAAGVSKIGDVPEDKLPAFYEAIAV